MSNRAGFGYFRTPKACALDFWCPFLSVSSPTEHQLMNETVIDDVMYHGHESECCTESCSIQDDCGYEAGT